MFNQLIRFLLKIIFWFFGIIASVITAPLFLFISALFPDFQSFLNDFTYFIDNYIINGLAFAREVFLNVTGYPRFLLQALVTLFMARIAFRILVIPLRFILNIWNVWRGSKSDSSSS